jgi:hypothetical protein
MAERFFTRLVGGAARHPRLVLALALVAGAAGVALSLSLRTSAAASTLVSSSSGTYAATQRYQRAFGEEPVEVLVKGDLQKLVLSSDIERLLGLEGCLSGRVPPKALAAEGGAGGPCGELERAGTVKVVFGPGTFINEAALEIDQQLHTQTTQAQAQAAQAEAVVTRAALARGLPAARAHALGAQARKIWTGRFEETLAALALQYGLSSTPSIENANFVSALVFDPSKPAGTPRARFAYLFPARDAALVSVRMRSGLSESQRTRTIALIRQAVAMPQWRLVHGERYLVSGEPVIVADLTGAITHSLELLLVAVALVMAATLGLIFSGRPRLLPLALAALAAALTFGALALAGEPLTMASIAVLPVLVGLAVDYAVQFQARAGEALEDPSLSREAPRALARAAGLGAPTIATAAAASAAAMLVLALSPVPMVRGFGVLLVVGLALALLCAFTAGAAALVLSAERRAPAASLGARLRGPLAPAAHGLAASWRGARALLMSNPLTRLVRRVALEGAVRRPERVLLVGLVLALAGWGLSTETKVQTDITKLVPQSLASLHALQELEHLTGVGGEIDLLVSARDVASPKTIEWMSSYESAVLDHYGYSSARGCGRARLCPAFSLPDLFEGAPASAAASAHSASSSAPAKLTAAEVSGLLAVVPAYFTQDVISGDRREATLAFGVRLMSLSQQQSVIEAMRARLHPPAGVSATLVGLPVLAAASGSAVADPWRRLETLLASLLAVALVLALAFRGDRRRTLVPLAPVVLASGWSALILFAVRVPLNPMSVTLSALVIAISTEFSVLLSERHRQERLAGHSSLEALRRSYARTGAAVATSGITAIAGFGVLVLSDINMLRQFGLVTLIDLSASLLGVLVALPAALVIAERDPRRRRRVGVGALALRGLAALRAGGWRWTPRRAMSGHER